MWLLEVTMRTEEDSARRTRERKLTEAEYMEMLQNNLGAAYGDLPASTPEERADNVRKAVECFQAALVSLSHKPLGTGNVVR